MDVGWVTTHAHTNRAREKHLGLLIEEKTKQKDSNTKERGAAAAGREQPERNFRQRTVSRKLLCFPSLKLVLGS